MPGTKKQHIQPAQEFRPPEVVATIFDDFLARFEEKINDPRLNRNDVVRDTLYQIYLGDIPKSNRLQNFKFPIGARALLASLDPRGSSLEADYYADTDPDAYASRKPLIWFWQMFDRSPLGLNAYLGMKLRQLVAPYIFKQIGRNFRCAPFVQWSFGYNLSIGDDVMVGRQTLLDDRGGLEIGHHVTIGEFVMIYSHSPDSAEGRVVNRAKTVIDDRVRLGFHSTILPGVHIGKGAIIEPMSVVRGNVKPHHVMAGFPAESVPARPKARARSVTS